MVVLGMFNYQHLKSDRYDQNVKATRSEHLPCILCGRECKHPKFFVWEHNGGGTLVTLQEGEELNEAGHSGADLGLQPIGPDCLKKHPQIKPFVIEQF